MDKITLKQICEQLSVTASWVGKVITKLKLKKKGRGSRRIFTEDEFNRIRNVKILRLCGISWSKIEMLRKEEVELDIKYFFKYGGSYRMSLILAEEIVTNKSPKNISYAALAAIESLQQELKDIIRITEKNKVLLDAFLNSAHYTFH
jgi:DNA-binding transcriptional MerR regulator